MTDHSRVENGPFIVHVDLSGPDGATPTDASVRILIDGNIETSITVERDPDGSVNVHIELTDDGSDELLAEDLYLPADRHGDG